MTQSEMLSHVAKRARALRLRREPTQRGLAERSGVSLGSLKRFEQTGQVSFESLLKIAVALKAAQDFMALFEPPEYQTLDEVLAEEKPKRQRGRIT